MLGSLSRSEDEGDDEAFERHSKEKIYDYNRKHNRNRR